MIYMRTTFHNCRHEIEMKFQYLHGHRNIIFIYFRKLEITALGWASVT